MKKLSAFNWITIAILFIGGINWGLIGVFGFDLVGTIFGNMSFISRLIYILVGLSSLYVLFESFGWGKMMEEQRGEMQMHRR